MSDISGTALFLEQNKILNKIAESKGENAANYALAFALSEVTGKDHQPIASQIFRETVKVMMTHDLKLQEAATVLEDGRKQIMAVLTSDQESHT